MAVPPFASGQDLLVGTWDFHQSGIDFTLEIVIPHQRLILWSMILGKLGVHGAIRPQPAVQKFQLL